MSVVEWSYWKAVVRYGHIGKRKEISVARYLVMPECSTMIDVMNVIDQMPGIKNRAMISLRRVEVLEYLEGIRDEKENFFLQRLFEGKQAQ